MNSQEIKQAIQDDTTDWRSELDRLGIQHSTSSVYTCPACRRTGTATGTCRPCGAWISPPATHVMVTVPEYGVEVVQRLDTRTDR